MLYKTIFFAFSVKNIRPPPSLIPLTLFDTTVLIQLQPSTVTTLLVLSGLVNNKYDACWLLFCGNKIDDNPFNLQEFDIEHPAFPFPSEQTYPILSTI